MSLDLKLSKKVSARDLFDGRLEKYGVREHVHSHTTEQYRRLVDGRNALSVEMDDDGFVGWLTVYGMNDPSKILVAIAEAFETEIFSEDEPQYWGCNTQEELDAVMKEFFNEQEFYANVCAYVRGEPNVIQPGTYAEIRAKIAKRLVDEDATIIGDKDRVLAEIEGIYQRDAVAIRQMLAPTTTTSRKRDR
jgi:hypothetical protein